MLITWCHVANCDPLGQYAWHKPRLTESVFPISYSKPQTIIYVPLSQQVHDVPLPHHAHRVLVLSANPQNRCRIRVVIVYRASQQGKIQFDKKIFYIFVWVSNHLTNQNPQSRWKRCEVQQVRIKKDAAHLKIICLLQRQFISGSRSDVYMKWWITATYLYGPTHHLVFET